MISRLQVKPLSRIYCEKSSFDRISSTFLILTITMLASLLNKALIDLSYSKNEYEVCKALEHAIADINPDLSFDISLHDSQSRLYSIVRKGEFIDGTYEILLLTHGEITHGEVHYSTNIKPDQLQLLTMICTIAALSLSGIKQQFNVTNGERVIGRTSLLMHTITEMLSEIIVQTSPHSIAEVAGQFLMGQLMLSSYAIIHTKVNGDKTILSLNGFSNDAIENILFSIHGDREYQSIQGHACIAMIHGGQTHGYIILGKRNNTSVTEDDVYFISIMGMVIAVSLERARLYAEERTLILLQKEMEIAGIVQQNLLPTFPIEYPYCECSGVQLPSLEIGGDYMDIIPYADGSLAVIMADVSGKGIGSAMIMSMVKSACCVLVKQGKEPVEIVHALNDIVYSSTAPDIFVTCTIVQINPEKHVLTAINAGHERSLVRNNKGTIMHLQKGCMVLGVKDHLLEVDSDHLSIAKGDVLCLYTDGVHDSSIQHKDIISTMLNELDGDSPLSAREMLDNIMMHQSSEPIDYPVDDKTLLLIRFK